jgi:hypothetical protein
MIKVESKLCNRVSVESKLYNIISDVYVLELSNNLKVVVDEKKYNEYQIGDRFLESFIAKGYAIKKGGEYLNRYVNTQFNQPHNLNFGNNPCLFENETEAYYLISLLEKHFNKGTFEVVEYWSVVNDYN